MAPKPSRLLEKPTGPRLPLLHRVVAALLAVVAWGVGTPARAADVSIMPVNVRLDRLNDRATVQVQNNGTESVTMQAEGIAWTRQNGQDVDAPTNELLVNPPIFTLQPGQVQVLRVGLRRRPDLENEATYRMVLREVPVPRANDGTRVTGAVRVLVALRVPVYVAPNTVRRAEAWQVQRAANGETVATVTNSGNVHLKVAELRLAGNGGDTKVLAVQGAQSVIFPGEQRTFRLQTPASPPSSLQVLTDQGLQHVALGNSEK
ncbi:fimbrial biogenesis chaperone [Roseateles amylovorans]|uniref:Fimbria/pilus periplasmic chaperone n=1 Tax=Roseateles amylovorans TaxID=2978473 RepID=A0ABY6AZH7_9BURK|nr:fimbria/pilus periplasmic chaperone [Roseateles amylovorans]UXH77698.1 fimbria/pilus periplasmic chaperone [Roseateles amylovorans]